MSTFNVLNPYTRDIVEEVNETDLSNIDHWMELSGNSYKLLEKSELNSVFQKAIKSIQRNFKSIAYLISSESGLCLKDSERELSRVLATLDAGIQALAKFKRESYSEFPGGKLNIIKEPYSFALSITPFNHPIGQVAHKVIPALIAGVQIIVKPCDKTPLSAIRFIQLLFESGLPSDHILIILTQFPEPIVRHILSKDVVKVLSFTGGYETGVKLARIVAEHNPLIRQIYELGGSSALVIADDANVRKAVDIALEIFKNSGQRCTTARKVLLFPTIASEFIEAFVEATRKLIVGDPLDPESDIGTLIDEDAARKVELRVDESLEKGARLLLGHRRNGAQYDPTILIDVPREATLIKEETFGPVAALLTVDGIEEACEVVSDNGYRLAGSIVTKNFAMAKKFADSIRVGQFNFNGAPGFRLESAPFGGFGWSGNGVKEGVDMAVDAYTMVRTFYCHD